MKKKMIVSLFVLCCATLLATGRAYGQGAFSSMTGKSFNDAMPDKFYLEGNAIPTEKRNSSLLMSPSDHRFLVGLLDTSGYSSQVQMKYSGFIINEGPVTLCGKSLGVGSFGFGMKKPAENSPADATFLVYDQGGKEVIQCMVKKDLTLQHPVPLQVILKGEKAANLALGRYIVEIKP